MLTIADTFSQNIFSVQLNDFERILLYIGIYALIVLMAYLLHRIILRIFGGFLRRETVIKEQQGLKLLRKPLFWFLTFLFSTIYFDILSGEFGFLEYFQKILYVILVLSLGWIGIRSVRLFYLILLTRYDINEKDNLNARKALTQFRILERIIVVVIVIVAIGVGLMSFESVRKLGVSLFASAGVAGIIIGLAAQKIIATFLAGLQIAITQPIRLDDVVIVEGEWGWIEEINLSYVVVRIWDKRRLVVPTTYFIEKPFQNWTRVSADILGTVFLYTDYNVPFNELREELTRLLKSSPFWDGQVNVLQVTDATERTIEVRALMSAVDSPTAWNLRVYVREKLIEFLQQNYPESLPRTRVLLEPDKKDVEKNPQNQSSRSFKNS